MDLKKILITNSYIIGTVIMVVGFIWMVSLAIVGTNFEQTMAAFFFTIFGLVFWALAYHYSSKRKNMMYQLKKEEKKTQKKQHDFIRH